MGNKDEFIGTIIKLNFEVICANKITHYYVKNVKIFVEIESKNQIN